MENSTKPALTFKNPEVFKYDAEKGYRVVDKANSEEFRLLECLGRPKVFYAVKANKYFKDVDSLNPYTDEEIQALDLPIPAEIENARRKVIKAANDAGVPVDFAKMYAETCPKELELPAHISSRIITLDPTERMIQRINRSTLGK